MDTQPALKILTDEGFTFEKLVDIFEAGAVYGCDVSNIRAVRESREAVVTGFASLEKAPADYLISNGRMAFRACKAAIEIVNDKAIQLDHAVAKLLNIGSGDTVRYVSMRAGGKKA